MRTHSQQGRTYEVYGQALRCHLLPHFGQKDIATITREEVKQLAYGMLAQGKSRNTVMVTLAPLREMFNHAIEDRHVAVNPALGVMRLTKKGKGEQREKVTFLTREEVSVFLETCREHRPDYAPLVLLLVRTGLRIGEACALQWGDLDFLNRFIEVRRTYSNGRIEETPKSSKSRRVDMSQQLTEALKALLVERKKETLRKGWGEVPPWIFLREDGACLTPNYVRMRVWPKLSAKTGLRYVRIHDLRHTFASLLIQNGESLAYVKEQLGHHSIQITVDTYGHLIPGGNKAAVDRLDEPETATIRNLSATTPQDPTGKKLRSA
jgi:integrase